MYVFTAALSFLLLNVAIAHPRHLDEDPECKPPHHHQRHEEKDCCKMPNLFSKTKDEMDELVHKCFEEAGIKKHGPHHEHHGPTGDDGPLPPPPLPPFPPKIDSKFDAHGRGTNYVQKGLTCKMQVDILVLEGKIFTDKRENEASATLWLTNQKCAEQCFLKSQDLLDDEGDLKVDELKALVAEKFTGDWASIGSAAIEKCLEKAQAEEKEVSKCKAGSKRVLLCIARESFMNCPASDWTESDVCTAAKERVNKCPHSPPPMNH